MLVAGVDSSTQSTKVLLCQADDGAIVIDPSPAGGECQHSVEALVPVGVEDFAFGFCGGIGGG